MLAVLDASSALLRLSEILCDAQVPHPASRLEEGAIAAGEAPWKLSLGGRRRMTPLSAEDPYQVEPQLQCEPHFCPESLRNPPWPNLIAVQEGADSHVDYIKLLQVNGFRLKGSEMARTISDSALQALP